MDERKLHLEHFSQKEKREMEARDRPSEEFREGRVPFGFRHTFPGGEKFIARQSNKGQGMITLEKDGAAVLDFSALLPEGWKFVTPTYFQKHPEEESLADYFDNDWAASPDRKMVLCGEFKTPQDILGLLHEIGHAVNDTSEENDAWENLEEEKRNTRDSAYTVLLDEEIAKNRSKSEGGAWAWAIRAMRRTQAETGADFRGLFSSPAGVKEYVHYYLANHRRGYERIIREDLDPSFYKELQTLFDRWQYAAPPERQD